ncbi:ECF RNA polymerase sigma factor SigM [Paenibacillus plantiphilus]|uniref:ECF RNA polymerase sigma factor SigM n=1 Tax=Paenibacillus plantiphilus TaxID=2905650 RepID=A0ABN8G2G0_9BACL|nr:sigma-70 family RNA polymerase sigma factor [Paenibacillus plantiphilus]CAH1197568.1 ECF RNA polymerase sigma factor SigM [Paenibacillus plantiphilus]
MNVLQTIHDAQNGSRDAFISLIRNNEGVMYAIARNILRTDNDAADAMQEAILKAYSNIGNLREPAYFRTWLIRILINECRQIVRYNSKFVSIAAVMEPTAAYQGLDSKLEMEELLEQLDMDHKEVVVLYYMEDISVKEIAGMLDISEGTVKSRLYRARTKLATLLKDADMKEEHWL